MRSVPVSAVGSVPKPTVQRATNELSGLRTLADVTSWARSQAPPASVAAVVTQDEYTHDVVLPFDGSYFLAFDAT